MGIHFLTTCYRKLWHKNPLYRFHPPSLATIILVKINDIRFPIRLTAALNPIGYLRISHRPPRAKKNPSAIMRYENCLVFWCGLYWIPFHINSISHNGHLVKEVYHRKR